MTDDRIMEIAASLAGFAPEELRPEREKLVAFARAIRLAVLEEAAGACEAVRDLKWRGTVFYSAAATECATTIRALAEQIRALADGGKHD